MATDGPDAGAEHEAPLVPRREALALVRTDGVGRDGAWMGRWRHVASGLPVPLGAMAAVTAALLYLGSGGGALLGLGLMLVQFVALAMVASHLLRRFARRRLLGDARRLGAVGALVDAEEGVRVRVRGRVLARSTLSSLLGGDRVVYSRVVLRYGPTERDWLVHERALDFVLVGDDAKEVLVEVASARVLMDDPPLGPLPQGLHDRLSQLPLPPRTARRVAEAARRRHDRDAGTPFHGAEVVLHDEDEVWVVGEKAMAVDGTLEHHERQTPWRVALRGEPGRELVITPVDEDGRR